jgi:hypothetical protein
MSVTFEPTQPTIDSWVAACGCGDARSAVVYRTYDAARAVPVYCGDEFCAAFPGHPTPAVELPSVNVSNQNAGHLLDLLGLTDREGDLVGHAAADDFLGRVLIAQGLNPTDAGVPVTEDGNIVDCGRPAGYADTRLDELRTVAEAARRRGVTVQWA